jgi:hypothetical protein
VNLNFNKQFFRFKSKNESKKAFGGLLPSFLKKEGWQTMKNREKR